MSAFFAYYGRVLRRGGRLWWQWIVKYWLPSVVGACLASFWQWWAGVPVDPTWKDWIPLLTYFAIFAALAIFSIVRAPVEIDADTQAKLDASKNECATLRLEKAAQDEPLLSPVETARLEECAASLLGFNESEKGVLRHIVKYGDLDERRFPPSHPRQVIQDALVRAQQCNLVRVDIRQGTRFYRIVPQMQSALEALLLGG